MRNATPAAPARNWASTPQPSSMQPDRPLPVLDTVHKRTATHTTMNEFVVEFYGFGGSLGLVDSVSLLSTDIIVSSRPW